MLTHRSQTKGGVAWHWYEWENLKIQACEGEARLKGSPNTFLHGSNGQPMLYNELDFYAQILANETGLDWSGSKVKEVHLGENIQVERSPCEYFQCAIHAKGLPRRRHKGSLYFGTNSSPHTIILYDKGRQLGSPNLNLLRIESKYKRQAVNQKLQVFTLADLMTHEAKLHALNTFEKSVDLIQFQNAMHVDYSQVTTPLEAFKALAVEHPNLFNKVLENANLITSNKRRAKENLRQAQKKFGGSKYDYAGELQTKIQELITNRTIEIGTQNVAA